jgi:DNA-binding NarL/FixJ family response regulator
MGAPKLIGLIADEDPYFRTAVSAILIRQLGFADVLEAGALDEALDHLSDNPHISIVLLDISMPGMRAPSNLRAIRECFPQVRVTVNSRSSARRDILLALEAGVHGYMLKTFSFADLISAVKTVLDGGIYVPSTLADISSEPSEGLTLNQREAVPSEPAPEAVSPLTPRQQEVLDLLTQGKTNKEIALALGVGEGTVKIHMAAIFRYFGVNNRAAAAVAGARPYRSRKLTLLSA